MKNGRTKERTNERKNKINVQITDQKNEQTYLSYYYHFRSTLKRDDFFAFVYSSNGTVSQTSVSSGLMKMRCFGWETNNVCQTTVACLIVHVAGRFSSFRLYFSSYNLLIGWQVLGFQLLSRITQVAPVQMKVVYVYYSAKRTTPFFITEEELLNFDFHTALRVDFRT